MGTRAILFFTGLAFVGTLVTVDAGDKSVEVGDHLVPVANLQEVGGSLEAYRTCWQEKLLVTPGEIARFIYLPGLVGEETSVSIYRVRSDTGSDRYAITGTYASRRLWSYFTPGANLPGRPQDVPVKRGDAELPESTAMAVRALWMLALQDARKPPASNIINIDSSTEIYSAVDEHGRLLIAKGPEELGPITRRLFKLTDSLMEYAFAKPARRTALAGKIRKEADDLRGAFRKENR